MLSPAEYLARHGISVHSWGADGQAYATCPQCSAKRQGAHKHAKCLSVKQKNSGPVPALWYCNNCGFTNPKGERIEEDAPSPAASPAGEKIVAVYEYCDESGVHLFDSVRYSPKKFRQRRPNPAGSPPYLWDMRGVRKVLYRLPELIAALQNDRSRPVFIAEGEKDVDALRAMSPEVIATCNAMGAGKWRDEFCEPLAGCRCIVIADKDEAGRKHAQQVAVSLAKAGIDAAVMEMPGEGNKDAADWIATGGDAEGLWLLADAAKPIEAQNIDLRATALATPVGEGAPTTWFGTDKSGRPRPDRMNTDLALRKLGLAARHNSFRHQHEINGRYLDGKVNAGIALEIRQKFEFYPSTAVLGECLSNLCYEKCFNPIVEYLVALKWDGVARLDTWLAAYLQCPADDYHASVGRLILIGAVRRALAPGCEWQLVPIFEGPEGAGKSSMVKALVGCDAGRADYYSDQRLLGLSDREQMEQVAGVWIHEWADLAGMSRAESEAIKSFISRTTDRARPAYGHGKIMTPRTCIFIGTTNHSVQYLQSQTGNRRFLPVSADHPIDVQGLVRDRDQLWAEAVDAEGKGEPIHMPKYLWGVAGEEQKKRASVDPWDDRIAQILGDSVDLQIGTNALLALIGVPLKDAHEGSSKRLARCVMRAAPDWKQSENCQIDGRRCRGYKRMS